jgi:hypothetical protein
MQEAYSYYVIKAKKANLVYIDKKLLGTLEKKSRSSDIVFININEQRYKIEPIKVTNGCSILITNTVTEELTGTLKISSFVGLFPKVLFEYNNTILRWATKNLFSLHWQWKNYNTTVIEAIENFQILKQKGVVMVSELFADSDLLIMLGVYLRNNIRILSLKELSSYNNKKNLGINLSQS